MSRGDTYEWSNLLTLGYDTSTPTRTLSFDAGVDLRFRDEPGDDTSEGFEDPFVRFAYGIANTSTLMDLNASFARTEVNRRDFDLVEDGLPDQDLSTDDGDLERYDLRFAGSFGRDAPFGADIFGRFTDRQYIDTTDPDLFDSITREIGGALNFRLSPVLTARLTADYRDFDADDLEETDNDRRSIGAGFDTQYDEVTLISFDLSYVEIREFQTFGTQRILDEEDDLVASLSATRQLPNGTVFGSVSQDLSLAGDRTAVSVGRSLTLPDGELAFSVGVSSTFDDPRFIGSLDYLKELPRGTLTIFYDQEVGTGADEEEFLTARLGFGYEQFINSFSRWRLDGDVQAVEDTGEGTTDDRTRARISASYIRDLTADWDLIAGYEYEYDDQDNSGSADSNSLFVSVARTFRRSR